MNQSTTSARRVCYCSLCGGLRPAAAMRTLRRHAQMDREREEDRRVWKRPRLASPPIANESPSLSPLASHPRPSHPTRAQHRPKRQQVEGGHGARESDEAEMEGLGARGTDDEGQGVEGGDGEDDEDEAQGSARPKSPNKDIRITNEFIQRIHGATLDNGGLNDHIIERFRNPLTDALDSDPRLSIKMYLSTTHASANTYNNVRAGISTSSPPRGFDDELNRLNAMDSPHNFSSTLSLSRYPMHYNPQSSRQMNSQRPQRMQIIQDASETELVLSGNIAYNELKAKYIEAAAELRATQKLNSTYTSLLQYRNTLAPSPFVTAASTPPHGSSISLSASQRLPKIEFSFNLLTQSDCPNIRFFFKKDWQEYCHQRKNAGNGHTSMLGCLQDEDGEYTTTDSARLSRFYQHAKSIFNMFYSHFLDAESWGKTSSDVADYFYRAMAAEFPEFRFCNDGKWKARLYAIGKYPDWKRDYRDKDRLRRDVVLESLRLDAELKKSRHQFSSPPNLTRLNKGRNLYTLNSEKDSSTRLVPNVSHANTSNMNTYDDPPYSDVVVSSPLLVRDGSILLPPSPTYTSTDAKVASSTTADPKKQVPSAHRDTHTPSASSDDTVMLTPPLKSSD